MSGFRIVVPATTANLGSGFDAIGAALELYLQAELRPRSEGFNVRFTPTRHAPTHNGFEREILRGMHAITGALPPVELVVENSIPLGCGLGSSAAALVLGLLAADTACGLHTPREELITLAARLEGHPDNTTPAFVGGVVVSVSLDQPAYVRIAPPVGVRAVVAIPDFSLATERSRAVLPKVYSKEDCVFNVQRAALLAASLLSGDLENLRIAMQDRLHQPYRAPLVPGLEEALALNLPGVLGIALSGAGPTILALAEERSTASVRQAFREVFAHHKIGCEVATLDFALSGAKVLPVDSGHQGRKPALERMPFSFSLNSNHF